MKKINESDIAAVATRLEQIVPNTARRVSQGQLRPPAVRVIHCVLSLHTSYDKVVAPRLEAFMDSHPDTQRVVELANLMASYPTPYTFMKQELNFNSEQKARILQAVVKFVCQIVQNTPNVPEEEALKQWATQAKPQDYQTLNIKGFGLAGFQYLRILFGADTIKPTVHIKRFISDILNRKVSDVESLFLLEAASERASLSVRAVDLFIWDRGARGTATKSD